MAVSITTLLPPTRSGRTLLVSSWLLGAGALLQIGLLGWHLLRTVRTARPTEASVLHFAETIEPSTSSLDTPASHRDSVDGFGSSAAAPTVPPAPLTPGIDRPTPAPPERYSNDDLLEQGRLLRQNGDVDGALAKLRQAQAANPADPRIMAELGLTYEKMQLPDRAFEQWQRLYALGDAAGPLYDLADGKLHAAPAAAGNTAPGATSGATSAMLTITDVHAEDLEDEAAERKVSLKIVVKNRPGSSIDPRKVKIETYFYDKDEQTGLAVQTDAQTGYRWLTAPVDWANDQSEVLETTYMRPKTAAALPATPADEAARAARRGHRGKPAPEPAATPAPAAARSYLGYIVRLYYDRQLQDVRAEPERLALQFPPPPTLPEDLAVPAGQ